MATIWRRLTNMMFKGDDVEDRAAIDTNIETLAGCVANGKVAVAAVEASAAAILAAINLQNGSGLTPAVVKIAQGAAATLDLGAVALKSQYIHGIDGTLAVAAATLELGYSDDGSSTAGGASNYVCIWGPASMAQYGGIVRDWGKIAAWCPTVPAGKHLVLKTTTGGFGGSITISHPT